MPKVLRTPRDSRTLDSISDSSMLDTAEVAQLANCSIWTVRRAALECNDLRYHRFGRLLRFSKGDVKRWMDEQAHGRKPMNGKRKD